LLSDVRSAASEGFSLVTDPQTVVVDGSRLVYDTEPALGSPRLVAVLSASRKFNAWVVDRIHSALRGDSRPIARRDIVTLKEVSVRARCAEKTVHEWRKLPAAPKPFRTSPALYDWQDWRRFLDDRERYRNKKTGAMPAGR
jgi:hypothetical protein